MMQSVGRPEAIEDRLLDLAHTAGYGTLSLQTHSLTKELLAESNDRDRLLDAYEIAVSRLYEEDLDRAAEELLEVMAELEGRCSPQARL